MHLEELVGSHHHCIYEHMAPETRKQIDYIRGCWERTTQELEWLYDTACPRNFLITHLALNETASMYFVPRGPGRVKLKSQKDWDPPCIKTIRFIADDTCKPLYRGGYYFQAMVNDYARQGKRRYAWLNSVHDGDAFIGYLLSFSY